MSKNATTLPVEISHASIGNIIHFDNLWFDFEKKSYRAELKKSGLRDTYNFYIDNVLQEMDTPQEILPFLFNLINPNKIDFESDLHLYRFNSGLNEWLEIPKPDTGNQESETELDS